jgi:hypothetical protein
VTDLRGAHLLFPLPLPPLPFDGHARANHRKWRRSPSGRVRLLRQARFQACGAELINWGRTRHSGALNSLCTYAPRGFTVGFRSCSPTCPSCLDPGLPIHITWHFEIFSGSSSGMISTTCPCFSLKVPMSLNPSAELSTMRQGSLFGIRSRLTTRLAPFFRTIRFDRRFL